MALGVSVPRCGDRLAGALPLIPSVARFLCARSSAWFRAVRAAGSYASWLVIEGT